MDIPSWKACTQCSTKFFADQPWKKICLSCWKESKGIKNKQWRPPPFQYQPPPKAEPIPDDMLKRLIYLCHPDKHNNNQASHLATDWLLKQRK